MVAAVHRIQDLHIRQEHEVVVPLLDGPNIMGESKPMAVPNVIHPQVEPNGAGRPVFWLQRR